MTNFLQIRQALAAVLLLLLSQNSWAQVTTNGSSGLALSYTSLANAINALNGAAITSPIVITLDVGYNETAPAGGYIITAQGSAANTIQINGNNNTITASGAHNVGISLDAIFKLVGADFVTLENFTMEENPANIVNAIGSNTKTEFGVALFYNTNSNGATNNTIQNNTIRLDRTYQHSFGIYSNTRHTSINSTITADATAAGRNINNKIYANDISNVNYGICFISPASGTARETGNDIGGSSPTTGNRITNWGSNTTLTGYIGVSGTMWGIYFNHQDDYNISYNLIESSTGVVVSTFSGIFANNANGATTAVATNTISNNQVTINSANTISGTQFSAIRLGGSFTAANTTQNVTANRIVNCAVTGASSVMPVKLIFSDALPNVLNITANTFENNRFSLGSALCYGIESNSLLVGQLRINENNMGTASAPAFIFPTNSSNNVVYLRNTTATATANIEMNNNNIYSSQVDLPTFSSPITFIENTAATNRQSINDNRFHDINLATAGNITFINNSVTLPAAAVQEVNRNTIVGSFNKTRSGGTVTILNSGSTSNATADIRNIGNNFSNINVVGTTTIAGWLNQDGNATSGTLKTITGNVFENWQAVSGSISVMTFTKNGNGSQVSNNVINNMNTAGSIRGIANSGVSNVQNYQNNTITNLSGGAGVTAMDISSTSNVTISIGSNTISALNSSSGNTTGILASAAATGVLDINSNTISNLLIATNAKLVKGISITGSGTVNIRNNSVWDIRSSAPTSATLSGIEIAGGVTVNITKNKIYDITSSTAFSNMYNTVAIRLTSAAPNYFIANNRIAKIYAPISEHPTSVIGIYLANTGLNKRLDILYNTIYLDGTSTGANFGSACLWLQANATATTSQVFLNNNILVNLGTHKGGGGIDLHFRSSTTFANYNSSSNNNLYYVNRASANASVCYASPTSYLTLAALQAAVAPAESNSVYALPLFLSLDGNATNFLHLAPEGNCQIEGKGAFIASVTDDNNGEVRHATTPDIGADEFVGLPYVASVTNPAILCIGQTADITAPAITAGTTAGSTFTYWTDATATTTFTTPSTAAVGTYYIKYKLGNCEEILSVVVASSGNTASTAPIINPLLPEYCPNTVITLSAAGGTAGTGSDIYWYSAANGGGTALGTGSSITVSPASTTAYFARRQGVCNTTADDNKTVNMRSFVYALNNTTAANFCTDGSGWHHFYSGGQIILSLQGDLSTAGTVTATIGDNGTYYSSTGTPANCATLANPGLARFEMARNWNISYTGTLNGTYNVRFYYTPAERVDVETAAANWIAANLPCNYAYKYNAGANGWFWFKNTSGAYTAPQYDGLQLSASGTGTANGINYVELTNVSSFSGGSGAIILESPLTLPIEWLSFEGHHAENRNFLYWATASESNNAYFDLERSADGASNFQLVAKINSQGDSQSAQYYNFVDNNPLSGTNYYRLRQVDIDGSQNYSKVIAISANTTVSQAKLSPNPASNQVEYQYISDKNEAITATIYNAIGQLVKTQQLQAQIGYNRLQISLENLPAGAYQIHIQHQSSTKTAIIIKE